MSETTVERDPRPAGPDRPGGQGSGPVRLGLIVAGVLALGVVTSLPVLLVVLALVVMIFLHELGHFVMAKAAGMKVTEFFIGFGPRLWSFQRGETTYGLKAIPAGAYVRIIGMSNLEVVDPADEDRTYRQKSYGRRLSVAVAGSTMHLLIALALIYTVLVGFGEVRPDSDRWTVGRLSQLEGDPGPAVEAGVELGDRIVAVDGRRFESFDALARYLQARPGETVSILVERDGRELALESTLDARSVDGEDVGFLGVGPEFERVRSGPLEGAVEAASTTAETAWLSVKGLAAVFSPSGISGYLDTLTDDSPTSSVGEPPDDERLISIVGAVQLTSQADSVADALQFLFLINVFIGLFNMVPLPPFDGGHVAIATYERIRSRRGKRHFADVTKLMPVTYAVVAVLAFIFVSTLYLDLVDPIKLQ